MYAVKEVVWGRPGRTPYLNVIAWAGGVIARGSGKAEPKQALGSRRRRHLKGTSGAVPNSFIL